MHAAGKLARQRRIDQAMAFEPALSAERFRHDIEAEMGLAARPVSRMAFVVMGLVIDPQALWGESLAQLLCDDIARSHDGRLTGHRLAGSMDAAHSACFCRVSSLADVVVAPA